MLGAVDGQQCCRGTMRNEPGPLDFLLLFDLEGVQHLCHHAVGGMMP
jgi:hypothetical protein